MKKSKSIIIYLSLFISILLFTTIIFLNFYWNLKSNKFNYNSAKIKTIDYFNSNEKELNELVEKILKNKISIRKPYKGIIYASYCSPNDNKCKTSKEEIDLQLDYQGIGLGGQDYGIIYCKEYDSDLIIYDEKKERGIGNNIEIKQRIKDNWFFHYTDWDGKIDIDKIK